MVDLARRRGAGYARCLPALWHPAADAGPQIGFGTWRTREPTSLPCQIMCTSAPAAGSTVSPTPSISGSRFPSAGRSAVRVRTSTRRIIRTHLASRPSRRSRGGCGTSLNATAESGIRSGWESNDSPQDLRDDPAPATAAEAIAALKRAHAFWQGLLQELPADSWREPLGPVAGPYAEDDGAELRVLRDLYRHSRAPDRIAESAR
jgi:hypothetical protein